MRFRIHFNLRDGSEDTFIVSGTLKECVKQADAGVTARCGDLMSAWVEELEDI